ncbi:MAG TPA: family 1 glycosylhydrolase [Planctomycetota bacterium]|nr:family 1 glycosylhydrolase [Planctomycetota bacterium]
MLRPRRNASAQRFIFATGIECSCPVIKLPDGRKHRMDEMEKTGHYRRWREDFALVNELGIEYLRYGPPLFSTHLGPGRYNWSFADDTFNELRRRNITPIVDLCHFGVPDWIGDFQNEDWPHYFAEYAAAFAKRFPWVRYYTPVNEIFIAARFSAELGWWNERLKSDEAFVRALKNLAKAHTMAAEAILHVRPTALFIQSESTEYFHARDPDAVEIAHRFNQKRFLSLDLCYGYDMHASMFMYLTDHGLTRKEYEWFAEHGPPVKPHCIMGNDYYVTNEHLVSAAGSLEPAGETFGYYVITKQYFERYHLPVMHTETNFADADHAPRWLAKQWSNMLRLKLDGVPIIGFTWYSLTDQVDWDTALRENNGNVNPLGLVDLDRQIRPVGEAYRELVAHWRDILPADSVSLDLNLPELNDALV